MGYRLGVDVGGTFTDLLLLDDSTGGFWRHKTPSTPHDSSEGILNGVNALCAEAGMSPRDIAVFLHGTTVATNAVLEGKGARVGLITTEGYRQIMQIARSFVPGGLAGWIVWPKPEPLAKLEDTVEIKGRMDAQGREVRPVDEADIRKQLEKLKAQGVEALTISLINAYLNGEHELKVAAIAREIMPDIPLSLSHEVLPEMQEYERTLTTVANAAVRPVVGRYVRNLRSRLEKVEMTGSLSLLRSDGGLMSSAKSEEHPVSLLMSGPAGGGDGRPVGGQECRARQYPDPGRRRHLHRRGLDRTRRAPPGPHHRGRAPVRSRLLAGREDGGRWRRLHRLCARADPRASGRAAIGGRGAGAGGLWQGRRRADRHRRERGLGLSAGEPPRRQFQAGPRGRQEGGADHRRQAGHRPDGGRSRHHRHRQ